MISQIDAVIFDMDGTLIDSMWLWGDIDKVYLKKHGLECPEDLAQALEGKSFTESAIYFKQRFNIEDTIEDMKKAWNDMAWEYYTQRVPLKDGVLDFLETLKQRGIKMGIGTSNSPELLKVILDKFEIRDYFDSVRTSCEVERGKPYPDVFLKVAEDLDVEPCKCLVLEDVPNGVLAAKRAGMKVWAIADETSKHLKAELIRLSDDYIENYEQANKKLI